MPQSNLCIVLDPQKLCGYVILRGTCGQRSWSSLHCCLLVSGGAAGGLESEAICALENMAVLAKLAHTGAMVRGDVLACACLCRRIPWHGLHGEAVWYKIFPSAVSYTFTSFKWGQHPSTSELSFKGKKSLVTSLWKDIMEEFLWGLSTF